MPERMARPSEQARQRERVTLAFESVLKTLLVCSVPLEAEPLIARMDTVSPLKGRGVQAWSGELGRRPVILVVAGMGKTNAARSLTVLLERERIDGIVGFGVAGAYPGSGLQLCDVALATREHYGDEGVDTPRGWLSCEGIGIPLAEVPAGPLYNDFPVDSEWLEASRSALEGEGSKCAAGAFVTVSCCSGTSARGRELEERFGAICETMEGAAYAHIAAMYSLPFLEARGVSNHVEDRDPSRWRLRPAAEAVAAVLATLLSARPTQAESAS